MSIVNVLLANEVERRALCPYVCLQNMVICEENNYIAEHSCVHNCNELDLLVPSYSRAIYLDIPCQAAELRNPLQNWTS